MQSFEFYTPTKFILGKDADLLCGREVKRYSDKVLFVHYGDDFTYRSGLHGRIMGALKEAGLTVFELSGVRPNPKAELVYTGIGTVRQEGIGCILAAASSILPRPSALEQSMTATSGISTPTRLCPRSPCLWAWS